MGIMPQNCKKLNKSWNKAGSCSRNKLFCWESKWFIDLLRMQSAGNQWTIYSGSMSTIKQMNHNPRHLQTANKFLYSSEDSSVINAPAMEVTIRSSPAVGMHAPPTGGAATPILSAPLLLPKSHWYTCHQGGTPGGVPAFQSRVPVCCLCSASPLLSAVCSLCHTCPFSLCFFPGWLLCNSCVIV